MSDFNFHTEGNSVVERWGQSIQGKNAACKILGLVDKIDILINNAGVMAIPWETNKNGIEKTLAINHLEHFFFLLTKMLMPVILDAGPGARIVTLSSGAYKMAPFDLGDWNFSDGKRYDPMAAYAQSKTANILFTVGLAKRAEKYGVQAFAVHPGFILGTSLITHLPDIDFTSMDALSREKTGFPFEDRHQSL